MMNEPKVPPLSALVRPTLDTPFHIDYGWWERKDLNLNMELRSHLCPEHREMYSDHFDLETIDWVNEETGEVRQVNGIQHVLQVHCSKQPNYIGTGQPLVDAVFRVFLANGNTPLTPEELGEATGYLPERILRTLSGRRIYKGIRPVHA